MDYLDSYWCRFLVESCLHSAIALVVAEGALRIWEVSTARERFRFRLPVLWLPPLMFPLFQLWNPERGSFYFVQDSALFSSGRWLRLELAGMLPFVLALGLALGLATALTVVQEVLPILRMFRRGPVESPPAAAVPAPDLLSALRDFGSALGVDPPPLHLVDQGGLLLTDGARRPRILVSQQLLERLSEREMKGALAHEMAHIARRSQVTTTLAFAVRLLTFFNPVSLLVFRRLVQDDELVCDEMTAKLTGDPQALASALSLFRSPPARRRPSLRLLSRNLLLEERIARLNRPGTRQSAGWAGFLATWAVAASLCYWVV